MCFSAEQFHKLLPRSLPRHRPGTPLLLKNLCQSLVDNHLPIAHHVYVYPTTFAVSAPSRALADASIFSIALVTGEKSNFQFILRLLYTNVDGKQKVMYALTKIKGVGRRYSNLVCKKADVDLNKRYVEKPIVDFAQTCIGRGYD